MSAVTLTPEPFFGITWTWEYRLMAIATAGAPRTTKCSPARIIFPGARADARQGSMIGREDSSLLERSSGIAYDRALVSGDISTSLIGKQISAFCPVELCRMDH